MCVCVCPGALRSALAIARAYRIKQPSQQASRQEPGSMPMKRSIEGVGCVAFEMARMHSFLATRSLCMFVARAPYRLQ